MFVWLSLLEHPLFSPLYPFICMDYSQDSNRARRAVLPARVFRKRLLPLIKMSHIHPTQTHVGFSHSLSFSEALISRYSRAIPVNSSFHFDISWVYSEAFWCPARRSIGKITIFHVGMTVVTYKTVKLGDWNCGLSWENLRKMVSFGPNFPINTEMLFHSLETRGPVGEVLKQLKNSVDPVYVSFGLRKKANVQSGLFNLIKLRSNFKCSHLMWKYFIKPPGAGRIMNSWLSSTWQDFSISYSSWPCSSSP